MVDLMVALSTSIATMNSLTHSRNTRSEQLLMMPTEKLTLTDKEWLPGEHSN